MRKSLIKPMNQSDSMVNCYRNEGCPVVVVNPTCTITNMFC